MEDKEKVEKLTALVALILHIHFSNAHNVFVHDKRFFYENFGRVGDPAICERLGVFVKNYPLEQAEKILDGTHVNELLGINEMEMRSAVE